LNYIELIGGYIYFVGAGSVMRELRKQAEVVAETDAPVLILGERGSGKEALARLIHTLSLRPLCSFESVNCAALPGDVLEGEIFGEERDSHRLPGFMPGKLELCENGTLLLNEITEMPIRLQDRLLEVLQAKRLVRPGHGTAVRVDVRIVATSTASSGSAVLEDKLSAELYTRLSAYTLCVPPLRERREDVPHLLSFYIDQFAEHYGVKPRRLDPTVVKAYESYSWPGNLTELRDFVKRYLITGSHETAFPLDRPESRDPIGYDCLMWPGTMSLTAPPSNRLSGAASDAGSLKSLVRKVRSDAERNAIAAALESTGWNRKAAARLLKVSYRTLLYKIDQYKLESSGANEIARGFLRDA